MKKFPQLDTLDKKKKRDAMKLFPFYVSFNVIDKSDITKTIFYM